MITQICALNLQFFINVFVGLLIANKKMEVKHAISLFACSPKILNSNQHIDGHESLIFFEILRLSNF